MARDALARWRKEEWNNYGSWRITTTALQTWQKISLISVWGPGLAGLAWKIMRVDPTAIAIIGTGLCWWWDATLWVWLGMAVIAQTGWRLRRHLGAVSRSVQNDERLTSADGWNDEEVRRQYAYTNELHQAEAWAILIAGSYYTYQGIT